MSFLNDPNRIPQNYGVRIAAGLIFYFLLMKFTGLSIYVELRLLNLFILVGGVYFALRKLKNSHEKHLNYFRALITGVATSAIGTLIFAAFLFFYMQIDTELMQHIKDTEPMGRYLNPYMAAFIVALEGVFSGLLVTFILINYVHTDEVNVPQA
jgi:glucan phosphoethanolaminetransferase (alkaline phosphatase superfamily)